MWPFQGVPSTRRRLALSYVSHCPVFGDISWRLGYRKGRTQSRLCPAVSSALREGSSWRTQKLSFPFHSWGTSLDLDCGFDPGPLRNHNEIVIVMLAAQLGQHREEAVGSSSSPSSLLASSLTLASCQWSEGWGQPGCLPQGVGLLGSQLCESADTAGSWCLEQ